MEKGTIYYSIIIPHKNIPNLLKRCIDSIPERPDTEIIIVDDNSDNNIVDFQSFPGLKRNNCTCIFDKSNKGAGHARNLGINQSKGIKILFADADDFFNYCINDILNDYINDKSDLIFFNANSIDTNTYLQTYNRAAHINHDINQYIKGQNPKALNSLRYNFGEPWSKIIDKSLIINNHIYFDEIHSHNDTTFSYLIGHKAKLFKVDERALYCVTVREGSISVSLNNNEKKLIRIDVFARKEIYFKQNNISEPVIIHWYQLAQFYLEDKTYFRKAVSILIHYNYTPQEIKKQLIRFLYRTTHSYIRVLYYYCKIYLSQPFIK